MPALSWQWLVQLRRTIHSHPEPGFEERVTTRTLRRALREVAAIPEDAIRTLATTGMIVDIMGTGAAVSAEHARMIALRTDLDALQMTEGNTALPYRSQRDGFAHMCGHDGHMAALIGTAVLLNSATVRAMIPSNCGVRLLFQPAEEGPGGAQPMIAEGCLEDVAEVFGWHNWPEWPLGTLLVKERHSIA